MNRAEFIERCQMGGYCTERTANEYSKGKEEFEDYFLFPCDTIKWR